MRHRENKQQNGRHEFRLLGNPRFCLTWGIKETMWGGRGRGQPKSEDWTAVPFRWGLHLPFSHSFYDSVAFTFCAHFTDFVTWQRGVFSPSQRGQYPFLIPWALPLQMHISNGSSQTFPEVIFKSFIVIFKYLNHA